MLRTLTIDSITTPIVTPKKDHDDLSTKILSNYLFKDIDNRIKFFQDMNSLFNFYLTKYANEYVDQNFPSSSNKPNKVQFLKQNIKLVYKGGNMINEHIKKHQKTIDSVKIDIDLETLSDYDFAICINYIYILHNLKRPITDTNLINLTNMGNLIASSIIRHFFNHTFCYEDTILKKFLFNPDNGTYELGLIDRTKLIELKDMAEQYFNSLPASNIDNIEQFLKDNKDKILNKDYKDQLNILFDIIKLKHQTNMEFIGFSIPTTFNRHSKIFTKLKNITEDNSIKLNKLVRYIAQSYKTPNEFLPNIFTYDKQKIEVNSNLDRLGDIYNRIKTNFIEIYPSYKEDNFGNLLPLSVKNLFDNQIKNLNNLVSINDKLSLKNFYSKESDNLTLNEDIELNKMIFSLGLLKHPYTSQFINNIHTTHENMISMSANCSLLFGSLNSKGDWTKINNFNLFRVKIPIRYYFELNKSIRVDGSNIKYIFFDYLGELIDLSIPLYGDSYFRNHFITTNMDDNSLYKSHFENLKLNGTNATNTVTINTHTILYNIDDIMEMLFRTGEALPWTNPKYDKRIGRLIILYLVLLRNNYDESPRIAMYDKLIEYIDNFIVQYNTNQKIVIDDISKLKAELDNVFVELLNELSKLSERILPTDNQNMVTFLDITKCYLTANITCLTKFNKVKNYKPYEFLLNEEVVLKPGTITF
jgi:hypothetical protein